MILNNLDLGSAHPFPAPDAGQVVGSMLVEGGRTIVWARGMKANDHSANFWAKGWQATGGQTALSINATRYVLRQAEELANNPDLNPVYIRWQASADSAAVLNVDDQHDGWYVITSLVPDYTKIVSGLVPVKLTARLVASGVPRPQAVWYSGGALSTNYSGASQIAVGYPFNAANQAASAVNRTGGEGSVPLSVAPSSVFNPLFFTPSATVADWYKGGCRIYDTATAGGNAVPTSGTFTHANWVEVFNSDHRFEGDCIITNGLHLYRFQTGQPLATAFVWSTAQSTPGWAMFGTLNYYDNAGGVGTVRGWALQRVGLEELRLVVESSTAAGHWAEITFRLQRGQYFVRSDCRPLTQAWTTQYNFSFQFVVSQKISYNSGKICDVALSETSPVFQTDYGHGANFAASTAQPFIAGLLYQNQPSTSQPYTPGGGSPNSSALIGAGDSSGPAQNAVRSYGVFALPFGTATTTTDKLQAEAESVGTAGSWVSAADGAASAGNAEKLPSGSAADGVVRPFGTSVVLAAGTYNAWFRMRVAAANAATTQIQVGIVANGATFPVTATHSPNSVGTGYSWKLAGTLTANGSDAFRFFLQSLTNAATTDFFIDEAVLAPLTLSTANTGPQELWSQFLHDRATKLTRA